MENSTVGKTIRERMGFA